MLPGQVFTDYAIFGKRKNKRKSYGQAQYKACYGSFGCALRDVICARSIAYVISWHSYAILWHFGREKMLGFNFRAFVLAMEYSHTRT